jgi:hypothetical protein
MSAADQVLWTGVKTYNHSLGRVTVVENGLNDIVSVAVSKQFLQSRSVEDFSD